jgi:hypothetical protein
MIFHVVKVTVILGGNIADITVRTAAILRVNAFFLDMLLFQNRFKYKYFFVIGKILLIKLDLIDLSFKFQILNLVFFILFLIFFFDSKAVTQFQIGDETLFDLLSIMILGISKFLLFANLFIHFFLHGTRF